MFWSLDFLFTNGNSKTKNDWIFDFHFKIEKPKLKYKAFFFIMVKKGFTKLKKRDDFHFLLLKTKNKITRKQKQKKNPFFHILLPEVTLQNKSADETHGSDFKTKALVGYAKITL